MGLDPTRSFRPLSIAILTVSDTRTPADDRSGDTLAALATDAGHRVVERSLVRDEQPTIAQAFRPPRQRRPRATDRVQEGVRGPERERAPGRETVRESATDQLRARVAGRTGQVRASRPPRFSVK